MILHYTQAQEEDIPLIFTQARHLVESYEDLSSIDFEKVMTWMERKIASGISSYTRVTLEGSTCAYYRLCEDGELDDLYVLPAFQNMGIGSAIINKCIAESMYPLYLYVFIRNTRAVSFYARFGFTCRETVSKTRMILSGKG